MMWHISHTSSHNSANNAPLPPHSSLCVGHPQYPNTAGCGVCSLLSNRAAVSTLILRFPHPALCHTSDGVTIISQTESNQWCVALLHWLVAVSVFGLLALVTVSAAATDHTPCDEPCSAKCCDVCPPHTHTQWCGVLGHALFPCPEKLECHIGTLRMSLCSCISCVRNQSIGRPDLSSWLCRRHSSDNNNRIIQSALLLCRLPLSCIFVRHLWSVFVAHLPPRHLPQRRLQTLCVLVVFLFRQQAKKYEHCLWLCFLVCTGRHTHSTTGLLVCVCVVCCWGAVSGAVTNSHASTPQHVPQQQQQLLCVLSCCWSPGIRGVVVESSFDLYCGEHATPRMCETTTQAFFFVWCQPSTHLCFFSSSHNPCGPCFFFFVGSNVEISADISFATGDGERGRCGWWCCTHHHAITISLIASHRLRQQQPNPVIPVHICAWLS